MKTNIRRLPCAVFVFMLVIISAFKIYSVFAADSEDVVTATINYYYFDNNKPDHKGTSPFPSFVANMPKGSAEITQKSPIVPGFSPCDEFKNPLSAVTISFNEDSSTDVFYFPAEVDYLIRLYKQDLNNDEYSVAAVINSKGVTGSEPDEFGADFKIQQIGNKTLEDAFEGFTLMYHVPEVIAADGSTEFECYYDRNYYLVSLDLGDGAYGVEPLYVPYEYPISLGTPIKTGYVFDGWKIENADTDELMSGLPSTMPAHNIHCTAKWRAVNKVNYTIVFCNADIDDGSGVTKYSHWGDKKLSELPDTELSLEDIIEDNKEDISSLTDYEYFTFDPEVTAAKNNSTITVKSDGSTIVRLYYKRNKYKLRFGYLKYTQSANQIQKTDTLSAGTYYIQSKRSSKIITPYDASDRTDSLSTVDFAENTNYLWTLVDNGSGGYYVQASDGNYLTITLDKVSVTGQPSTIEIQKQGTATNVWTISYNGVCLNDKANKKKYAGPSQNLGDAGSAYYLLPATADGSVNYVTEASNIKVATATGNGKFLSSLTWNGTIPNFPELSLSSDLTEGEFVSGSETYKYIELVAEYNANIEDIWPAVVIGNSGDYSFGSWSTQDGTEYRKRNSEHANIVGAYPYLSSEMIVDPTKVYDPSNPDQIAQLLWAWWGKTADNKIKEHRIKIFFETLDGQTPDDNINGINYVLDHTVEAIAAHNGNTRIDPFTYKGFTIIPSEQGGHTNSSATETGQYQAADGVWTTEFHYTRDTYSLSYYEVLY